MIPASSASQMSPSQLCLAECLLVCSAQQSNPKKLSIRQCITAGSQTAISTSAAMRRRDDTMMINPFPSSLVNRPAAGLPVLREWLRVVRTRRLRRPTRGTNVVPAAQGRVQPWVFQRKKKCRPKPRTGSPMHQSQKKRVPWRSKATPTITIHFTTRSQTGWARLERRLKALVARHSSHSH